MPLQRVMVDFGADGSFAEAAGKKMMEHYGITVSASTLRKTTLQHAGTMKANQAQAEGNVELPSDKGVAVIIAEMDGSMVPIVSIEPQKEGEPEDGRKRRNLEWNEARLSLAREQGSVEPMFAATMGSPDEAGDGIFSSAVRVGFGQDTLVHGVGDGARWIADQCDRVFASQGSYLIDFFHTCEYLEAAAKRVAPSDPKSWMKIQKERLRKNRIDEVEDELLPLRELDSTEDSDAPIRKAWRYISNRPGQFRYLDATKAQLPIGSGEIESAHRYVPQKRLKLPGAWWKRANAADILALRVNRANSDWDNYWTSFQDQKAA